MIAVLLACMLELTPPAPSPGPAPEATAVRGMPGSLRFHYRGPLLRARPDQETTAPILLRVVSATPRADGAVEYEIAYMGTVASDYTLNELLVDERGVTPEGIPELAVRVISNLPETHGTDVFSPDAPDADLAEGYVRTLIAIGAAWLLVPAVVIIRRRMNRPVPVPVAPPPPPPTLADLLAPLLTSAAQRELSMGEQARLELLLLRYWGERLALTQVPHATAVQRLRQHEVAGAILLAVERWIHAPPGETTATSSEIAALLEPYQDARS